MFSWINALKNIRRQRKRYRILVPLLLVCAVLSGVFLTIADPCRTYADRIRTDTAVYTIEEAEQMDIREDNVRQAGQFAYMAQIGILLIGAAAVFYVTSLMIGERYLDIGILFSIGLSKRQIFFSLFWELCTVSVLSLITGLWLGSVFGGFWLRKQMESGQFPAELADFIHPDRQLFICVTVSVGILLLPLLRLVIRLFRTDPAAILRDRT